MFSFSSGAKKHQVFGTLKRSCEIESVFFELLY